MNKHRSPVWNDYDLRLQEVVPDRPVRHPQPTRPWPPPARERPDSEEDTVVALTWPQETGWRHH